VVCNETSGLGIWSGSETSGPGMRPETKQVQRHGHYDADIVMELGLKCGVGWAHISLCPF